MPAPEQSSRSLPPRPDLDQLRRQAKELVREAKAANLAEAQRHLAKEHGFPSWAALKHHVEQLHHNRKENAEKLINALLNQDIQHTLWLLKDDQTLATFNFATALLTGQAERVREELNEDASLAVTPISKLSLPPIIAFTRSWLTKPNPGRIEGFVACLNALLAAGADPNAAAPFEPPYQTSSGTPLYYAASVHGNRELTRVLLAAGARTDDTETLYHVVERNDPELLRILRPHVTDFGQWSYAFLHLMDFEYPDLARTFLELGGVDLAHRHPSSGMTPLHWAIQRGRSPEMIELLVRAGADPTLKDYHNMSAYALAARTGDVAALRVLNAAGTPPPLDAVSQFLAAAARNDAGLVSRLLADDPKLPSRLSFADYWTLHAVAAAGRPEAVEGLLTLARFSPDLRDVRGATALHWAALHGDPATVRVILAHKPDLEAREREFHATPLGWAFWASVNFHPKPASPRADYAQVVALLLDAGAKLPENPGGSTDVREVLRARGLIPS